MNGSAQQEKRKATRNRWVKTAVVASVAALVPTMLTTLPAEGRVVDVTAGHNITVFHNIDFVATFGHDEFDMLTVTVERNGVEIGRAAGEVFAEDPLAPDWALEVNHGVDAPPANPGDCWEDHTPDIRPGDHIFVTDDTNSFTDEVVVDNIAFTGRPRELANGDIVVPFKAFRSNGRPIPAGFIDSAEFRAESNNQLRYEGNRVKVERRPGAKPGQLWQRYPSPFKPSRNRDGWNQAQIRRALLRDGHATGFGHVANLPAESMLYDGLSDTPGAALGCSGPSARWQVNGVSPKVIGPANRNKMFKAAGRTFNAERVFVRLIDSDKGEPRRVVQKRATVTGNTWTVSFRPRQLRALDGRFRVNSLHRLNGETALIGGPGKYATRNLR